MAKTCSDRLEGIVRVIKFTSAICGGNVFNPSYKVTFLTVFVVLVINAFLAFSIYTMYVGVVVDGDWKVILQSLSLAGSALQGYAKLVNAINLKCMYRSIHAKLFSIYKTYQSQKDFLPDLRYRIDLIIKMFKALAVLSILLATCLTFYPLFYGQVYGKKILVMQFILPGVSTETDRGYWFYFVYHSFCIYLGALGNFISDLILFMAIVHVPLFRDILKVKCKIMNKKLLATHDMKVTMPMLKDIVQFHQSYIEFVQLVKDSFSIVIFAQIVTSVMSICCTIFSIIIKSWPAAFVYLIYSSIMLFLFCGLGNLVDISNDDVIDLVYCDILWYELSIPEQKLVLLMLRKSQTPISLTVGGIMPLSMSTALQLSKAIYSYLMMLVNFLEGEDI